MATTNAVRVLSANEARSKRAASLADRLNIDLLRHSRVTLGRRDLTVTRGIGALRPGGRGSAVLSLFGPGGAQPWAIRRGQRERSSATRAQFTQLNRRG